jgi:hypothetical protein
VERWQYVAGGAAVGGAGGAVVGGGVPGAVILGAYGGMVGGSLYDSADDFGSAYGCYESGRASGWQAAWAGTKAAWNVVSTVVFIRAVAGGASPGPAPGTTLPEPVIDVYRGVNANHPDIALAEQGIARAPGGHGNPYDHIAGNTDSIFTSWTTSLSEARMRADLAGSGGVVLRDRMSQSLADALKLPRGFTNEEELLRVGQIQAEVFERR